MISKALKKVMQLKRQQHLEEMFYDKNKTERLGELIQQYQPSTKFALSFNKNN